MGKKRSGESFQKIKNGNGKRARNEKKAGISSTKMALLTLSDRAGQFLPVTYFLP